MSRPAWGHVSRHCARCGKVGPRVSNPDGPGYIHSYCRTEQEKRDERQRHYAEEKRLRALGVALPPGTRGADCAIQCANGTNCPLGECARNAGVPVDYSFRCYSCAKEWDGTTPTADCPACGTTNSHCAANPRGVAPAPAQGDEWAEVERLRDLPEVDEALLNFKDDCTGDNAAMVVRAVRRAVLPHGVLEDGKC